jgi:aldose sugar dehydrogenase
VRVQQNHVVLAAIAICAFVAGFTMHKYNYFPYPQTMSLARKIVALVRGPFVDTKAVLSRQYAHEKIPHAISQSIDSALLPLRVSGLWLSNQFPVAKVAGGIAAIKSSVVIVDRLGNLYVSKAPDYKVTKLAAPPIPNNIAGYLTSERVLLDRPFDDATFRVYDIEYLPAAHKLAVSHEYFDKQHEKARVAVSTIDLDADAMVPKGEWKTIFLGDLETHLPSTMGGGRLASDGGGKIYLAVGYHKMPEAVQEPGLRFGRILEIDLNTGKDRTISMGHRNPQGLTRTKSGELFSTEHADASGDELNLVVEGGNYGFPLASLGTGYFTYQGPDKTVGSHEGFIPPVFAWLPAIAVSNLIEVRGFHPRWEGDLLIGSLKSLSLFRLRMQNGRVLYSEQIWVGQRIRDIAQLENGTIVLWTDNASLMFLTIDQERLDRDERLQLASDNPLRSSCLICHHLGETRPGDGAPSLRKVFGRRIASDNWQYSAALRSKEGTWNEQSLTQFLADTNKFAGGTTMPQQGLGPAEVTAIVKSLKELK